MGRKRTNIKYCIMVLLLCLLLTACGGGDDAQTASPTPLVTAAPTPTATPALTPKPAYIDYYHPVDGYTIRVDGDLELQRELTEIAAVFDSERLCITVYRQSAENLTFDNYTGYSNEFLMNKADHTVAFSGRRSIGGRSVAVTRWSRSSLQRVDTDRNHYITYDFQEGNAYYSIHVKSADAISDLAEFDALVESFRLLDAPEAGMQTIAVQPWRSEPVDLASRGWNEETQRFYKQYFGEEALLEWGLFETGVTKGDWETLWEREKALEHEFDFILCYSHFYRDPTANPYVPIGVMLEQAREDEKVVELTLQMNTSQDGRNYVYDILQGDYDAYLQEYAQAIAEFGHPVLFRLNNEMNGDWCPYCAFHTSKDAEIFVEVYRYIYQIFETYGANRNAVWVWNPNEQSFPNFAWNHTLLYYPGDAYVDVVGLTAYNTGTYYASYGESWKDFTTLYADLYDRYCAWFAQPFMITEFACASMGGDKFAWVEDMFNRIGEYSRIKVAVWWNFVDYAPNGAVSRSYILHETPELMDLFRRRLAE